MHRVLVGGGGARAPLDLKIMTPGPPPIIFCKIVLLKCIKIYVYTQPPKSGPPPILG
jgi:hypothetical protein